MKSLKFYNIYIFISIFIRNIIDIYSVVFLYQSGISIRNIVGIYTIVSFLGIFISELSLRIGNKIGYKYILILSSISTLITFYIINNIENLYVISFFLSLSIFTYHPVRHYYGLKFLNEKKAIGNILIYMYLASFLSSLFVIKKINYIYIIITIISIIPSLYIKKEKEVLIKYPNNIPKSKINFFILDQFKILFLLLEPIYLYTISNNIKYIGLFNIVITISAIIYIYLISYKINIDKIYKYINILFTIILLLKLNIDNRLFILILSFFEGIGIKTNELISTINLYNINIQNKIGYIIICEKIICLARTIILSIIFLLNINLLLTMYILLIGIFILGFMYKKTNISIS